MLVLKKYSTDGKKKAEKLLELTAQINQKILEYKAAQIFQIEHGGPGPVAEEEIMKIVNEHNGEFQIDLPDDPVEIPQEVQP